MKSIYEGGVDVVARVEPKQSAETRHSSFCQPEFRSKSKVQVLGHTPEPVQLEGP